MYASQQNDGGRKYDVTNIKGTATELDLWGGLFKRRLALIILVCTA